MANHCNKGKWAAWAIICIGLTALSSFPLEAQRPEDSVVLIHADQTSGYGVMWNGHIATVLHLVAGRQQILVSWQGQQSAAKVVQAHRDAENGRDAKSDHAGHFLRVAIPEPLEQEASKKLKTKAHDGDGEAAQKADPCEIAQTVHRGCLPDRIAAWQLGRFVGRGAYDLTVARGWLRPAPIVQQAGSRYVSSIAAKGTAARRTAVWIV